MGHTVNIHSLTACCAQPQSLRMNKPDSMPHLVGLWGALWVQPRERVPAIAMGKRTEAPPACQQLPLGF